MALAMLLIAEFAKRLPLKEVMSISLIVAAILAIFMAVSDYFGLILLLRLCQGCFVGRLERHSMLSRNNSFSRPIAELPFNEI